MNNLPRLTKIIVFLTLLLFLLQVVVANRLTTVGLTITELDSQAQKLNDENDFLERKIATFSSLTQISKRASELGFVKAKAYYLSPEFSVAAGNLNGVAR